MSSLCIEGRNTKAERQYPQMGSHGRERGEYVAEKLPGKEKEGQCMLESLLLWDEMDGETGSQKILELEAASEMDMQNYLLREI